jgi:zinc transporter ZupT
VSALAVFLAALATALATGLGAVPFLFAGTPDRSWIGVANGLAAGFMLGASIGLCLEGARYSVGRTFLGAAAGITFIAVAGTVLARNHHVHIGSLQGSDAFRAVLIVGVMTLHSFAEGVGVGVAFGDGATLGLLIALAIAVHNIPEGLAISLVMVPRGASVASAAGWSVVSSLPQPLMAVPAFLFVEAFGGFLPVGLGFAAGAMVWLVAADLLPEAVANTRVRTVVLAVGGASAAMLAFQLLLL